MNPTHTAAIAFALAFPLAAQSAGQWAQQLQQAKVSFADAIAKGSKEADAAVPYKAELELDKGALVYSIDLAQGTKTINVIVDAGQGKVVQKEVEDGDESQVVGVCKVSLAAAVEAAVRNSGGQPLEATMTLADGRPVIEVRVFDAKAVAVTDVRVDGLTAEILPAPPAKAQVPAREDRPWTDVFHVTPDELGPTGRSTFMILEPGYRLYLRGKEGSKEVELVVSVLDETRKVDGVETRIVEERETKDGLLAEVSRNFFAISKRTSSIYYFGEEVDVYEHGKIVNHEGAWLAGEHGARFGIYLPGTALLGARFYQEIAPDVAMDRAEIVSLTETVDTPAGKYERAMKYEETTPLELAREYKWFAPGIGLIQDADLKLYKIER